MTTSSSIQLPAACPEWCMYTAAQHLKHDDAGDVLHKGPLFGGWLRAWGLDQDGRLQLSVSVNNPGGRDFTAPDQLVELARAAEDAARWLEQRVAELEERLSATE